MDLTDAQWAILAPLLPKPRLRRDRRGRPWRDPRDVLNGILWVLRTGAPWKDLPDRYPSYQTCHRRFQDWQRTGVFESILQRLAEDLRDRGKLDLTEGFIDASFTPAK
jgi:transposase